MKDPDSGGHVLVNGLFTVPPLREREVLSLIAEGRSNQAIGDQLYISSRTVESHVSNILTKLGLLPSTEDDRRVLAVLTYLRSTPTAEV